MDALADVLEGGFADPVLQSQTAFKALMDALSRPGLVRPLAATARPPEPLTPLAATLALTLFDHDTPIWLDHALSAGAKVAPWLAFHTGAPVTADPAAAAFALLDDPAGLVDLARFALGTDPYPDRSTTLIVPVAGFSGGSPLEVTGPGVNGRVAVAPVGLPAEFPALWSANNALFPRGVDLVLAGPDGIVGLTRTTRIRRQEG